MGVRNQFSEPEGSTWLLVFYLCLFLLFSLLWAPDVLWGLLRPHAIAGDCRVPQGLQYIMCGFIIYKNIHQNSFEIDLIYIYMIHIYTAKNN